MMRISQVETIMTSPGRNYLIVKITTDDGIIGYGDATLNGRELAVKTVIDEYIADIITGQEASNIAEIWQMIYRGTYWRGGPVLMSALAGIDMALWDIMGKKANVPLYSLLGGKSRDKIQVYRHIHGSSLKILLSKCEEEIQNGFPVIRYSFDTKDSFSDRYFYQPHQDITVSRIEVTDVHQPQGTWDSELYINDLVKITALLREKLGDDIGLIHDVHSRISDVQAYRVAKELEPYHLFFIEDIVDPQNKLALEKIRQNSTIPIGLGELYNTIEACQDSIMKKLIDYIRVDISHFGGITPLIKLANYCEVFGIKTAFHGPSDISPIAHAALAHIDMNIYNFGIQEAVCWNGDVLNVFNSPVSVEKGFAQVMEKPGLGIEIDEAAAKKYPYKKTFIPILRDRMRAIQNW